MRLVVRRQGHGLLQEALQARAQGQGTAKRVVQAPARNGWVQAAVGVAIVRPIITNAKPQFFPGVMQSGLDLAVIGVDGLGQHQHGPSGVDAGGASASRSDWRRAVHADAEEARAFLLFGLQVDFILPGRTDVLREPDTQTGALGLEFVLGPRARAAQQRHDLRRG